MSGFFWRFLLATGLISVISNSLLGWFTNWRIKKLEKDYQKEMSNFSKYTEKKHEQYQLLWEVISEMAGYLPALWSRYTTHPNFEIYTDAEVKEFLERQGLDKPTIRLILDEFREDKKKAIETLQHIHDLKVKGEDIHKKHQELVKRYLVSEIYLSDEVKPLAKQFVKTVRILVDNLNFRLSEREIRMQVFNESEEKINEMIELREKLMAQMKKELMGLRKIKPTSDN